jgi:hypothetical protein
MEGTVTPPDTERPASDDGVDQIRHEGEVILGWCRTCTDPFAAFEGGLFVRLMRLGCLRVQLFLVARRERWERASPLPDGTYRLGDPAGSRRLQTRFGEVTYTRAYLIRRAGGSGSHPLDAELGLTRDGFSPWVMGFVSRLATRLSFAASRTVCRSAWGWSPSTEAIEQLVLGLGRQAPPFAQPQAPPEEDGEVLVIEVDGKCRPTATDAELRKRRGRRTHRTGCACGCPRHRGQAKRKRRGSKQRRNKGDKSKNGKEVMVVVMYTLRRGEDGTLQGPINKKVGASFAGRKAAAAWARAEASKRGFGPETTKTVQIVIDGAKGLKQNLEPLFPKAILTLDVCHVVEKLWALGHHFHAEASAELKACVEGWKELVDAGRAKKLVEQLRDRLRHESRHGPGTQGRRKTLAGIIGDREPRLGMMRYREWREQDLVLATGQVEGAVRHVVGERFDGAGMRWIPGRAEALLHLRCIELNGDGDAFLAWSAGQYRAMLDRGQIVLIRSNQSLDCQFTQAA